MSDYPDSKHAAAYLLAWHDKGRTNLDRGAKDWHINEQKPTDAEVMTARFKQFGFGDFCD